MRDIHPPPVTYWAWSACHGGISTLLPSRTGLGQRATEGYPPSSHHVLGLVSVPRRDIHPPPITYWAWSACHGGISTLLPSRTGLGQRATEGYPSYSYSCDYTTVVSLTMFITLCMGTPWSASHRGISTLIPSRTGLGYGRDVCGWLLWVSCCGLVGCVLVT